MAGPAGIGTESVYGSDVSTSEPPTLSGRPRDAIGRDYGLGDDGLALIRSDGYIGLLADCTDLDVLRGYRQDVRHTQTASHGQR